MAELLDPAANVLADRGADRVVDADGVPLADELCRPTIVLAGELDHDLADVLGREVQFDVLLKSFPDRVSEIVAVPLSC